VPWWCGAFHDLASRAMIRAPLKVASSGSAMRCQVTAAALWADTAHGLAPEAPCLSRRIRSQAGPNIKGHNHKDACDIHPEASSRHRLPVRANRILGAFLHQRFGIKARRRRRKTACFQRKRNGVWQLGGEQLVVRTPMTEQQEQYGRNATRTM